MTSISCIRDAAAAVSSPLGVVITVVDIQVSELD